MVSAPLRSDATLMKTVTYSHPKPRLYQLEQLVMLIALGATILIIPLLIVLAFVLNGFLFIFMAFAVAFFIMPIVMLMSITPKITLSDESIRIKAQWWSEHEFAWGDILDYKPYPLLPLRDHEVERRLMQGRTKYIQATGMMLVVDGLPWQYRMGGIFAGERGKAVIAVTNRAHTDYDKLKRQLDARLTQ